MLLRRKSGLGDIPQKSSSPLSCRNLIRKRRKLLVAGLDWIPLTTTYLGRPHNCPTSATD